MIKTDPLRRDVYKFATEQDNRFVFYCCTEIITFYLRTETWRKKNFSITFSAKKRFTFHVSNRRKKCYARLLSRTAFLLTFVKSIKHFTQKLLAQKLAAISGLVLFCWFSRISFHSFMFILLERKRMNCARNSIKKTPLLK